MVEELQGFNPLDQARKRFEEINRVFGGPAGTQVTLDDIADLIHGELLVTWLESGAPKDEQRFQLFNSMKGNPLLSLQPSRVDFRDNEVQSYALKWFKGDLGRLELLDTVAEVLFEVDRERASLIFDDLDSERAETRRQIKARQTAIDLLQRNLTEKSG